MKESVRSTFYDFNAPYEGEVPWFYQDLKGLVSIGVGILADPIQLALNLPLVHPDGTPADRAAIAAEWLRIKNLPPDDKGRTAAMLGHLYAKPHTRLRLTKEGLRLTLEGKLNQGEQILKQGFPEFEMWPADAQLATLSMMLACGPALWMPTVGPNYWPKLTAALRAWDFTTAAVECFLKQEKEFPGLKPRNVANRILYENAAIVNAHCLNPEVLRWPKTLTEEDVPKERDTEPELANPASYPTIHPFPEHQDIIYDLDKLGSDPPPPPDDDAA